MQLADAFLGGGSECIFFEIKGRWLKEEVLVGAPEDYQKELRDKYSGEKIGVGQIVCNILGLANRRLQTEGEELRGVERIFPVLVAYDYRLDAPLHPRFLARDFARGLSGDDTIREIRAGVWSVAPLTVMTIDDFEILESSVGEFSLCELLRDYSRECGDRFVSLHNFMASYVKYAQKMRENARVRSAFSAELRALEERFEADQAV